METKQINYDNHGERWQMSVTPEGTVEVYCNGERRYYDLGMSVNLVLHEEQYVYVYTDLNVFQFKFEDNYFLVGDVLDHDFEFLDEYAMYVFGEDQ